MSQQLLSLNWWVDTPIDFEHKKWLLLSYLQKQDEAFYNREFSPWLLHSEKLIGDMMSSKDIIITTREILTKKEIVIRNNQIFWEKRTPTSIEEVDVFLEILMYSIPLLENKLDFGKRLWKDDPTLLW